LSVSAHLALASQLIATNLAIGRNSIGGENIKLSLKDMCFAVLGRIDVLQCMTEHSAKPVLSIRNTPVEQLERLVHGNDFV
jgi:hypothetical protein